MKIHSGDTVQVITGKHKGQQGKVVKVLTQKNAVIVEGINTVTRRIPKQAGMPGQQIEVEKPLTISNVMLVCPHTNTPTRVGFRFENGKKVRFSKKSGKTL